MNETLSGILIGGSMLLIFAFLIFGAYQYEKEAVQECIQRLDTYQLILDEDKKFFCKHLI